MRQFLTILMDSIKREEDQMRQRMKDRELKMQQASVGVGSAGDAVDRIDEILNASTGAAPSKPAQSSVTVPSATAAKKKKPKSGGLFCCCWCVLMLTLVHLSAALVDSH